MTSSAPMLLIDPEQDGRIIDANIAALRFYNYTADEMRTRHTANQYSGKGRASRDAQRGKLTRRPQAA